MEARKAYIQDMKAQLKELMTTYDPEIMWFDGDWTLRKSNPTLEKWWTKADGKDLYRYLKSIKSSVIVNERVCRNFGIGDFGDLGGADMFGDSEAEETEITPDGIEETPKKEGFLKKLSRILFGEDDEDEKGDSVSSQKEPLTGENAGDIDLSDPNMQILQELGDIPDISDAPKEEEKPDPKEEKKKKKEKKKKEKKIGRAHV